HQHVQAHVPARLGAERLDEFRKASRGVVRQLLHEDVGPGPAGLVCPDEPNTLGDPGEARVLLAPASVCRINWLAVAHGLPVPVSEWASPCPESERPRPAAAGAR